MKGFPFKRHLIVLASCLLLIGIAIPVATFAKSTSGEPHRSLLPTKVTQNSNSTTGDPTTTTTTDVPCTPASAAMTVSPVLHLADTVHIHASIAPIPPETVTSEQGEGEFLQIFDTAHTITLTADYLHSADFSGIVFKQNDVIKACVINPDGDELATITVSVTPFTVTVPELSNNWAGYTDSSNALNPTGFTRVDGSWKVPSVSCPSSAKASLFSIWDGLGGVTTGSGNKPPLEQVGITIFCNAQSKVANVGLGLHIRPWYEVIPQPPHYTATTDSILPGDVITATTAYLGTKSSTNTCTSGSSVGSPGGNGVYQFTLTDQRTGARLQSGRICGQDSSNARDAADWIVEGHPGIPIPNFGHVDFSGCHSSNGNINVGPTITKWTLIGLQSTPPFLFTRESTSSLTSDGAGFTVSWKHA